MMVLEVPVSCTLDGRRDPPEVALGRLIRDLAEAEDGEVIALWACDPRVRQEVRSWIDPAEHRLVGIEACDGYDEILVEKIR